MEGGGEDHQTKKKNVLGKGTQVPLLPAPSNPDKQGGEAYKQKEWGEFNVGVSYQFAFTSWGELGHLEDVFMAGVLWGE